MATTGEVVLADVGTSVEYTAEVSPVGIVFHAELDPAIILPANGSVTFTWFKDRSAITDISFYHIVYTVTTDFYWSRLFVRIGSGHPVTGTYSCLIENSFMSEINVGMEIVQSEICELKHILIV